MGARPICALNSLRFGELSSPDVRRLFTGSSRGSRITEIVSEFPPLPEEVYFDKS